MKERAGRRYELRERARRQQETRRRIVAATETLHEKVGPAQTTVVEIARLAGVSRPTVYSHFPDERDLFAACGGNWFAANPRPAPSAWASIGDPEERVLFALSEVHAFYEAHEQMLANIARDIPLLPALGEVAAALQQPWAAEAVAVLGAGWGVTRKRDRILRAAVAHALDFRTWRMLVRERELTNRQAAALLTQLVACAAET